MKGDIGVVWCIYGYIRNLSGLGFCKIRDAFLGGPHNKDHSALGLHWGP